MRQALSQWGQQRMYLSLDTTVVWNCFCIVWVGVVYRGRTVPIAWRVVARVQQHGAPVDNSTGVAASGTVDARWRGGGVAS